MIFGLYKYFESKNLSITNLINNNKIVHTDLAIYNFTIKTIKPNNGYSNEELFDEQLGIFLDNTELTEKDKYMEFYYNLRSIPKGQFNLINMWKII